MTVVNEELALAFNEYMVSIVDDGGVPGMPYPLRTDTTHPATHDKLLIDDRWYEVIDVAAATDSHATTSPKTTTAVVFCRLISDPPEHLLTIGGKKPVSKPGAKVLQIPSAGPQLSLVPERPVRAERTTVERSISGIKTFEYRPAAAAAEAVPTVIEEVHEVSERCFVVERGENKPTLRLLPSVIAVEALPRQTVVGKRAPTLEPPPLRAPAPAPLAAPRSRAWILVLALSGSALVLGASGLRARRAPRPAPPPAVPRPIGPPAPVVKLPAELPAAPTPEPQPQEAVVETKHHRHHHHLKAVDSPAPPTKRPVVLEGNGPVNPYGDQ
jgi:hypothetical protein